MTLKKIGEVVFQKSETEQDKAVELSREPGPSSQTIWVEARSAT